MDRIIIEQTLNYLLLFVYNWSAVCLPNPKALTFWHFWNNFGNIYRSRKSPSAPMLLYFYHIRYWELSFYTQCLMSQLQQGRNTRVTCVLSHRVRARLYICSVEEQEKTVMEATKIYSKIPLDIFAWGSMKISIKVWF